MASEGRTRQLDTGWSWVILLCTFSVNFLNIGIVISGFAVVYHDIVQTFDTNAGSVGLILTIYSLSSALPSLGYSSLLKRFGYRKLGLTGSLMGGLCIAASSFSPNLIVFGVLSALAAPGLTSAGYVAAVALQNYFDNKRGLAGGIAATGVSTGYFVCGPLIQYISESYGWRGARLISAGILLNIMVAISLLRPHPTPQSSKTLKNDKPVRKYKQSQTERVRTMSEHMTSSTENMGSMSIPVDVSKSSNTKSCLCDLSLLKDPSTFLYLLGCAISYMGIGPMYYHLPNRSSHIGMSQREAAWIGSLFGICNAAGRLLFTAVVTLTPMSITLGCCVLLLISSLGTMAVGLTHGVLDTIVVVAVASLTFGGHICVRATAMRDIGGVENYPTGIALEMLLGGVINAFSVFFAGHIYDITLDYNKSFLICGGFEIIGAFVVCISVILYQRKTRMQKNERKNEAVDLEVVS